VLSAAEAVLETADETHERPQQHQIDQCREISVLSTLLGGGKTTERLLVRISIETHKTSPDFDQTAADKAKNRIKQALGEIGCDVFIETDR
jgi:hypothetical protein